MVLPFSRLPNLWQKRLLHGKAQWLVHWDCSDLVCEGWLNEWLKRFLLDHLSSVLLLTFLLYEGSTNVTVKKIILNLRFYKINNEQAIEWLKLCSDLKIVCFHRHPYVTYYKNLWWGLELSNFFSCLSHNTVSEGQVLVQNRKVLYLKLRHLMFCSRFACLFLCNF